jgi:hypothetical protein
VDDQTKKSKIYQYTVSISPHLHNRLDKHIFILKKLVRTGHTKQQWLVEAVEEKLKNEKSSQTQDIEKEKRVSLRIDVLTKKILEEQIQLIRCFRTSYSKRKWILDAIQEKLDLEEVSIKKRHLELLESDKK